VGLDQHQAAALWPHAETFEKAMDFYAHAGPPFVKSVGKMKAKRDDARSHVPAR
jgi:hypothetical protein